MSDVKQAVRPAPTYDSDFYAWSQDQAARLREERPNSIDWENVAEEIGSLGGSEKRAIRSNLAVAVIHLLKWAYQPTKRTGSWRASIVEHRDRKAEDLKSSPSLRRYPGEILARVYEYARAL